MMAIALNRRKNGRAKTAGLTVVELLVVIVMTALLSAIMFPALSTAKEKSRRAVCKSNIRQLLQVLEMYVDDNENQYLPSGGDDKGYYHSIILSDAVFTNLVDFAGGNSNLLYCPNIAFSPSPGAVPQHIPNIGYVIGYSYLAQSIAGSSKSPDYTVEPVKMPTTGTSTNELLADANYWTPNSVSAGYFPAQMKVAPHTPIGAAVAQRSSFTVGLPGTSVASVGAVGGNIGFADGHVEWRSLPQMQTNAASSIPDDAFGTW
jgi:prepilin-type processing-associated H-X9-DG protein